MMISGSKRGDRPKQHDDIIKQVVRVQKIAKEACLKGLKWLDREYVVASSI